MAKQIKAIKCPHCGSVEKTKLDKDLYHCENCNTDYFLDNDDVNININNTSTSPEHQPTSYRHNSPMIYIGIALGLITLIIFFSQIFNRSAPKTYRTLSTGKTITNSTPVIPPKIATKPKPINYSTDSHLLYTFLNHNNQPYSFEIAMRQFDKKGEELNGFYYEIRDVKNGQILKSAKLFAESRYSSKKWDFRLFNNNIIYAVYDDRLVYQFNIDDLSIADVTNVLFKNYSELSSGVATVNIARLGYGEAFYVLSNNGKEYYIFLSDNIITDLSGADEIDRELKNKIIRKNENYEKTEYCFAEFHNKLSLFKRIYYTRNRGSTLEFSCAVKEVKNSDKPYQLVLSYGDGPVLEEKMLAVDRIFFKPTILYGTPDQLIIKAKSNASQQAYFNIQSLDPNTGDIKWQIKGNENLDFTWLNLQKSNQLGLNRLLFPYNQDHYIIQLPNRTFLLVSSSGDVEKIQYKLQEVFDSSVEK